MWYLTRHRLSSYLAHLIVIIQTSSGLFICVSYTKVARSSQFRNEVDHVCSFVVVFVVYYFTLTKCLALTVFTVDVLVMYSYIIVTRDSRPGRHGIYGLLVCLVPT